MNPGDQFDDPVGAARDSVDAAVAAARDSIDALQSDGDRLRAASDLVSLIEQLYNGVTDWRARMAYLQHVRGADRREIARRTRRSPQRADQIIKAGRKLVDPDSDDTTHRGA